MSLQILTGPSAEPITLAEVKARLRLTATTDDVTITAQITAAREFAEKVTRRSLAVKTYAAFFDRFPVSREPIRIPVPPLLSVQAIKYTDNSLEVQTWDASEYYVASMQSPGLIVPKPTVIYPSPVAIPGAVEVDFTAGYGAEGGPAIPEHLREGIRQLTIYIYEHPEVITPDGLKEAPLNFRDFFNANKVWVF